MARLLPPPIRDAMFAGKDILQRTWILFFEGLFRTLDEQEGKSAIDVLGNTIGEVSTKDTDEVSMALLPRSESSSTLPELEHESLCTFHTEKSISTRTTDIDPGDLLTLFWTGV